jgi:hypothetical protein
MKGWIKDFAKVGIPILLFGAAVFVIALSFGG